MDMEREKRRKEMRDNSLMGDGEKGRKDGGKKDGQEGMENTKEINLFSSPTMYNLLSLPPSRAMFVCGATPSVYWHSRLLRFRSAS